MQVLGKNSMAAGLKRFLDFMYYAAWVVAALVIGMLVVLPFVPAAFAKMQLSPVYFELVDAGPLLTSSEGATAQLTSAMGKLVISGAELGRGKFIPLFGAVALGTLIAIATSLFLLRELRRLLETFTQNRPFDAANRGRLRRIALAVAVLEVSQVWVAFAIGWLAKDMFVGERVELQSRFDLDLLPLAAAAVIWILAEIFALGTALETEQELVV